MQHAVKTRAGACAAVIGMLALVVMTERAAADALAPQVLVGGYADFGIPQSALTLPGVTVSDVSIPSSDVDLFRLFRNRVDGICKNTSRPSSLSVVDLIGGRIIGPLTVACQDSDYSDERLRGTLSAWNSKLKTLPETLEESERLEFLLAEIYSRLASSGEVSGKCAETVRIGQLVTTPPSEWRTFAYPLCRAADVEIALGLDRVIGRQFTVAAQRNVAALRLTPAEQQQLFRTMLRVSISGDPASMSTEDKCQWSVQLAGPPATDDARLNVTVDAKCRRTFDVMGKTKTVAMSLSFPSDELLELRLLEIRPGAAGRMVRTMTGGLVNGIVDQDGRRIIAIRQRPGVAAKLTGGLVMKSDIANDFVVPTEDLDVDVDSVSFTIGEPDRPCIGPRFPIGVSFADEKAINPSGSGCRIWFSGAPDIRYRLAGVRVDEQDIPILSSTLPPSIETWVAAVDCESLSRARWSLEIGLAGHVWSACPRF